MPYSGGESCLDRRIAPPRAALEHAMPTHYYKRFRMEIDLDGAITGSVLPRRFIWVPWDESLVEKHAEVKFRSFAGEVDAYVFPCLGDRGLPPLDVRNPSKTRVLARGNLAGSV